jgi:hypothetical protein
MWLLLLIAVHSTNPNDIPGKLSLEFETKESCEHSLSTLKYWLKFDSFKVEGKCVRKS